MVFTLLLWPETAEQKITHLHLQPVQVAAVGRVRAKGPCGSNCWWDSGRVTTSPPPTPTPTPLNPPANSDVWQLVNAKHWLEPQAPSHLDNPPSPSLLVTMCNIALSARTLLKRQNCFKGNKNDNTSTCYSVLTDIADVRYLIKPFSIFWLKLQVQTQIQQNCHIHQYVCDSVVTGFGFVVSAFMSMSWVLK